jgi:hypothetical protein
VIRGFPEASISENDISVSASIDQTLGDAKVDQNRKSRKKEK